jgi:hypothetical protein
MPLALGFAAAVPVTWLQHRARLRLARRRTAYRPGRGTGRRDGRGMNRRVVCSTHGDPSDRPPSA